MTPWSIEECEAYAKQLRDKTRANTAEHAAQAIEYLLGLVRREWVGLTEAEINNCMSMSIQKTCRAVEAKLKQKNTWQDGDCKHCVNGCPACDARRQSNVLL